MFQVESFVLDPTDLDDSETNLDSSFLLSGTEDTESEVDPETQARLEALLEAAGKLFVLKLNHNCCR